MQLSQHTARLSKTDIEDLARASEKLVVVHQTIAAARYAAGAALCKLLEEANEPIERIRAKGARSVESFLRRRGIIPATPSDGTEGAETVSQDASGAAERGEG